MVSRQMLSGKRLLLVEDDYFLASELAKGLDEMGIDVVGPVPGVDEAFDAIHANEDVDAAILDINLGGQTVFPIADELDRRSIPFIFATAFEPDIVPDRHADKLVLRKPLEFSSVASALSGALRPAPIANGEPARNAILRRLPSQQLNRISSRLRSIHLPRGAVMEVQNQAVSRIYFPIDCVASLIAVGRDGARIETGLVGREGMTGIGVAIGDDHTPHELINQIEGDALVMAAHDFKTALELAPDLSHLAARFGRSLAVQISHTALANGRFELRQRLARWLLMVQDRIHDQTISLTHDYLSIMLGVRRASVTDVLHLLEGELVVRAHRSNIEIRDRLGLIKIAGEIYGTPEGEYERLMGLPIPFERSDVAISAS